MRNSRGFGKTKNKASARARLGDVRVPLRSLPSPLVAPGADKRYISLPQLTVMLWHLYRCANDPDAGYLDADEDLNHFVYNRIDQDINIDRYTLERLLWAGNMADQLGFWWSFDNKSYSQFVKNFLAEGEVFDLATNRIITPKDFRAVKDKNRYIHGRKNKRSGGK